MVRFTKWVLILAISLGLLVSLGCKRKQQPELEPKVTPPAIAEAGIFRAGVDLSTPPFAGEDAGQKAGIDVDVAAAVAERLGLNVEYVDVRPSEAATALAQGDVDAVFSVGMTGADLSNMTIAGTYTSDVPGLFVALEASGSVEPSLTLDTLPATQIAAQTASEAYWVLESEFGTATITEFESLREAMQALDDGEVEFVAGDALVGAYIARDFTNVRMAGQLADPYPLGIAVGLDNTALSDAISGVLDELAADGVLENIRRKWVGELPELEVPTEVPEQEPAQ